MYSKYAYAYTDMPPCPCRLNQTRTSFLLRDGGVEDKNPGNLLSLGVSNIHGLKRQVVKSLGTLMHFESAWETDSIPDAKSSAVYRGRNALTGYTNVTEARVLRRQGPWSRALIDGVFMMN